MNRRIFAKRYQAVEALENDCNTDDLTAVVDMRDRLYGLKRSVMTGCEYQRAMIFVSASQ